MNMILTGERAVTRLALWLSIAFLLTATALALFQVTTRFVFGHPSTWSEVITRSAMIWSVFLGVPVAYRYGAMISVEIIQTALPKRLGMALYLFANALSFAFFAILFWQGWGMTERVMRQTLAALEISIAWVYAALPVGAVFTMIAIAGCMLRAIRRGALPEIGDQPDAPYDARPDAKDTGAGS